MTDRNAARNEVHWAPRVPQDWIRRLYLSDARGLLDDELLDEVGTALFLRCQSILDVAEAKRGRVRCPRCRAGGQESIVPRPASQGDPRDALLTCPTCGWAMSWGAYHQTFKRRQLNIGGAEPAFTGYVERYPHARTARDRMLLVDRLLHEFHYSLRQRPDLPTRPVGVNLIEGRLTDVIAFLDRLTYGDASTAGLTEERRHWEARMARFRQEFLGQACRNHPPTDASE